MERALEHSNIYRRGKGSSHPCLKAWEERMHTTAPCGGRAKIRLLHHGCPDRALGGEPPRARSRRAWLHKEVLKNVWALLCMAQTLCLPLVRSHSENTQYWSELALYVAVL